MSDLARRIFEYLKDVGPAHPARIAKALNTNVDLIRAALKELEADGRLQYRIPSYYLRDGTPVIPFRESDPNIIRRQIGRDRNET